MQITLSEQDLNRAITDYLFTLGIDMLVHDVAINMTVTRNPTTSVVATIQMFNLTDDEIAAKAEDYQAQLERGTVQRIHALRVNFPNYGEAFEEVVNFDKMMAEDYAEDGSESIAESEAAITEQILDEALNAALMPTDAEIVQVAEAKVPDMDPTMDITEESETANLSIDEEIDLQMAEEALAVEDAKAEEDAQMAQESVDTDASTNTAPTADDFAAMEAEVVASDLTADVVSKTTATVSVEHFDPFNDYPTAKVESPTT